MSHDRFSGVIFSGGSDAYTGGDAYNFNGVALSGVDLVFSEGIRTGSVPEPSSFVTAGTGAMMALGYAWRRRRNATA